MFKYLTERALNLRGRTLELANRHRQAFSEAYASFISDRHEEFVTQTESWISRFPIWQSANGSLTEAPDPDILSTRPRYLFFEGEYLLLYSVSKSILGDHARSISARIISEQRIDYAQESCWGSALTWRMLRLSAISGARKNGISLDGPSIGSIEDLSLEVILNSGPTYHGYPLTDLNPKISIDWDRDLLIANHHGVKSTIDFSIDHGIRECATSMAEFICTSSMERILTKRASQTVAHLNRIRSMERYTPR
jgi:hypothetical protein